MRVVCMAPYSIDLRQKILQAHERGEGSQRRLAELFDVSISFSEKLFMQLRRIGHVEPKPHTAGGTASRINAAGRLCLQQWLRQQPDLTLAELAARLDDTLNIHDRQANFTVTKPAAAPLNLEILGFDGIQLVARYRASI